MIIDFFPLLSHEFFILISFIFILILITYYYLSLNNYFIRILIFLILVLLLVNPMFNSIGKSRYDDVLVLVTDKTQSIIETKKLKNLLKARSQIKNNVKNIEKLEILEIQLDDLVLKSNDKINRTQIFTKLQSEFQKIDKTRIAGIIILTDGIIHDLEKINSSFLDIPLHFLLIGKKNERDRSIVTKNVPEYALVGKNINFSFKIRDENYSNKVSTIFKIDGKRVFTKNLATNINHEIKLPIAHAGENLIEISIAAVEDELTLKNNNKVIKVNGIHEKLKVMLISGEPNMGLRNWRNILNSDPSIELLHFTILRPPSKRDLTPVKDLALIPFPTQELFSADLSKFNLIILDQYTLQGILPKKYLDNINKYVLDGGAILNISGKEYLSNKSLINSPLSSILPTIPEQFSLGPFLPTLTELGKRHPITNSLEENYEERKWGKWFSFVMTKQIAGKTLIKSKNYPLLIINEVSEGRVAQILSDQSWVWKKDVNNKGPIIQLLRNTIHWLLKTPELQENFLKVDRANDIITVKLNSLVPGNTTAVLTSPLGKEVPVSLEDDKNGNLIGKFSNLGFGKYVIKLNNVKKEFYIGPANNLEMEDVKSTEKLINDYFKINKSSFYSINWIKDDLPKIVKVYNKKNIYGQNWIGLLEKRIQKNDVLLKKELVNWLVILPLLLLLMFFCWFRDIR